MTGLEAILAHIEQEAQAEAQGLLDAAQAEAQATLESAQEEAQRRSQAILEEAQKGADAIRERAESAALLEKRDGLLRCKQQLIREALGQVCQELEQAPAQEYFSLLLELVGRWAQPGTGALPKRPGFAAAAPGVPGGAGAHRAPGEDCPLPPAPAAGERLCAGLRPGGAGLHLPRAVSGGL